MSVSQNPWEQPPRNLPQQCPPKNKTFLNRGKISTTSCFNVLPPKKTHKTTLGAFPISPTSPCFPNPRFGGMSHTAAFWLEPPSSSAGPFRGTDTKIRTTDKVKVLPGRSLFGEMELPHSLILFIYWIWIYLYTYIIYVFFGYSTFHEKSKYTGKFDILLEICTVFMIHDDTCITPQMLLKLPQGAAGWSSSP